MLMDDVAASCNRLDNELDFFCYLIMALAEFDFSFNPFPNKPWFLRVSSTSLLKTLWEKEKLLVTSNFFFSHSVFYPFEELSAIFIKFRIVICKPFQFGIVENLSFGKELTLYKTFNDPEKLYTTQSQHLMTLRKWFYENIVGK